MILQLFFAVKPAGVACCMEALPLGADAGGSPGSMLPDQKTSDSM